MPSGEVAASLLILLEFIFHLVHTNYKLSHNVRDCVMFGLYCIDEGWPSLQLLYVPGRRVAGYKTVRLHLQGCCYHLDDGFGLR